MIRLASSSNCRRAPNSTFTRLMYHPPTLAANATINTPHASNCDPKTLGGGCGASSAGLGGRLEAEFDFVPSEFMGDFCVDAIFGPVASPGNFQIQRDS